jgi:hypothetical protein
MVSRAQYQTAAVSAIRVRHRVGLGLLEPLNPFDTARKLDVDVWFRDVSSFDGLLARTPKPLIILSSRRPPGRQHFTCAHELGHLLLNHTPDVDLKVSAEPDDSKSDEELIADSFASYLLMPKTAVQHAAYVRNLNLTALSPIDLLLLATTFGVGCGTFSSHLRYGLRLIDATQHQRLAKNIPKAIREAFYAPAAEGRLTLIDEHWLGEFIDLRVGDFAWFNDCLLPVEDARITTAEPHRSGSVVRAVAPGFSYATTVKNRTFTIRVMPNEFAGRSIYRHLEVKK